MQRSTERILTTHVGSLVRPEGVAGHLDDAVRDVVRQQVDTGLDIVNDGEYGKSAWHRYIIDRLTGFEEQPVEPRPLRGKDRCDFPEFYAQPNLGLLQPRPSATVVTGPISYRGQAAIARDIERLKAAAAGCKVEDLFMTAVAPSSAAAGYRNEYYAS
ncbi:MAG TPA: hypothetical protein VGP41_01630, partial [Candidatus Lustribacter sp.]|nr:hypothetical protein [Candidatus Lustribacter sp.]